MSVCAIATPSLCSEDNKGKDKEIENARAQHAELKAEVQMLVGDGRYRTWCRVEWRPTRRRHTRACAWQLRRQTLKLQSQEISEVGASARHEPMLDTRASSCACANVHVIVR